MTGIGSSGIGEPGSERVTSARTYVSPEILGARGEAKPQAPLLVERL